LHLQSRTREVYLPPVPTQHRGGLGGGRGPAAETQKGGGEDTPHATWWCLAIG